MGRRKKGRSVSGWLILNKPLNLSSTAAVAKVRWLFDAKKAGHAGTLDPLATGMLPIALGEATKTIPYVVDGEKSYAFTIRWGISTNTDDAEGEIIGSSELRPDASQLEKAIPKFIGTVSQVPPAYSAIKIDGQRAYAKARAGEKFQLKARDVQISSLVLKDIVDVDHTRFVMTCGKGTYVRALARDLSNALGCFGHVSELHRIDVHPFLNNQMVTLGQIEDCKPDLKALDKLLLSPLNAMKDHAQIAVSTEAANRILLGNSVLLRGNTVYQEHEEICIVSNGKMIAIGRCRQGSFHPSRVLNSI